MIITKAILDELTEQAKRIEEYFYDSEGRLTETVDMLPGGTVLNIEACQWHSLRCLESGTILLEAKDGPYRPLDEDEIMSVHGRAL